MARFAMHNATRAKFFTRQAEMIREVEALEQEEEANELAAYVSEANNSHNSSYVPVLSFLLIPFSFFPNDRS